MSWSTSQVVVDGDTTKLEESFATNPVNESAKSQQAFALNVIREAFDSDVVSGAYNVSASGHSDPTVDSDRKSFSLSFSPTTVAVVAESGPEEFQDGDSMPPGPTAL